MNKVISLDNAATTKTAPEVVEAMLPYFTEHYGNPSSVYSFASKNKEAISKQRDIIADALGAKANEIYLLENANQYQQKPQRPAHSGRTMELSTLSHEIDLRGMDSIEAVCVMERYLDEAMRSGLKQVRIVHGKGTGVLRAAVQQSLRKNKFVKKFRLGVYGEGEDGVTIAEFG